MSDTSSTKTPDGKGMAARFPTAYSILFGLIIVVAALRSILSIGDGLLVYYPRPEAGIALNMRSRIFMFLDDVRTTTITKVTLAISKKHTYWLIGSILY